MQVLSFLVAVGTLGRLGKLEEVGVRVWEELSVQHDSGWTGRYRADEHEQEDGVGYRPADEARGGA
jgi:hypothetical protein